jgi:hypothetical protein
LIYHYGSKVCLWRAILAATIRFTAADPYFHWIMSHAAARPRPELEWHVGQYVRETLEHTGRLIELAKRAGRFVVGDPLHLSHLFIRASTRLYLVRAEAERTLTSSTLAPRSIEEHIRTCFRLFFR